jgi:DNA-binding PadR family transcriptional regulator
MKWTDGMLYPVLHRLEKQELIQSRWGVSETGRKRKYYQINEKGSKVLTEQQNQWMVVYSTLKKLWENQPCLS